MANSKFNITDKQIDIKMRIIIIIIICITFNQILNAQIKLQVKGSLNYSSRTRIDSIFTNYKEPILPDSLYTLEWNEINVVCTVEVGLKGEVRSIQTYPLNQNSIYFDEKDPVWELVSDSIKSASKDWKFKLLEWDIDSIEPEEARDTFRRYNREGTGLPLSGQPKYLLIISICNECRGNNYQFFHHINSFEFHQ